MTPIQIAILAVIQGMAELLPISSSAHVIVAAKLMGLNASAPQFTMLLVMLHTGTMFAVVVYFWKAWKEAFFSSMARFVRFARLVILATAVTGFLGLALNYAIVGFMRHRHHGMGKAEIEQLFNHLEILAAGLAAVGLLILYSGLRKQRQERDVSTNWDSLAFGLIQGLCLPFRGFSRSGATISIGLLLGVAKKRAEEFSFALAVAITPAAVGWEARRLLEHQSGARLSVDFHAFLPGIAGMVLSFLAGLAALTPLSALLERGKWWVFGVYCLAAAAGVFVLYLAGY